MNSTNINRASSKVEIRDHDNEPSHKNLKTSGKSNVNINTGLSGIKEIVPRPTTANGDFSNLSNLTNINSFLRVLKDRRLQAGKEPAKVKLDYRRLQTEQKEFLDAFEKDKSTRNGLLGRRGSQQYRTTAPQIMKQNDTNEMLKTQPKDTTVTPTSRRFPNSIVPNTRPKTYEHSPNPKGLPPRHLSGIRTQPPIEKFLPDSTNNSTADSNCNANHFENYNIGKLIGQGAYATVKLAVHKVNNRKYAIKTYEKYRLLDPQRKKNVSREIKILEKLSHSSIVKLFEVIDTPKHLHLVLEYVPGCSLHGYLKKRPDRKLEEAETKRIFRQLLSGIEYCHNNNVTHRDLKLENILLDDKNNVRIIDFGFATCFPHEKKVKVFCGTPTYMAPEIIARKEYSGPPADVWALGVLLYAMLCGTFPFKASADKELYRKIQRGHFVIPQHVSGGARNVLNRVLILEPAKRMTVSEILRDE
mmetsp:Transcript_7086/g.6937  ORF Transcript_7086/g.6937 Transcript_7086/m.6937 type:complete len:472 (+) Transcript_7086:1-1416(+)